MMVDPYYSYGMTFYNSAATTGTFSTTDGSLLFNTYNDEPVCMRENDEPSEFKRLSNHQFHELLNQFEQLIAN